MQSYTGKQSLIEALRIQWLSNYNNVAFTQRVPQLLYFMFSFQITPTG